MQLLKVTQNTTLRWITGTFKTTPSGMLPVLAGVMPIHHYMQKLRVRSLLRIHTLMATHPIKALFPNMYERSTLSLYVRFTLPDAKPASGDYQAGITSKDDAFHQTWDHGHGHVRHDLNAPACTYAYDPLDPECRPGDHISDVFHDCITLHLEHPKKSDDDALQQWIAETLTPRIEKAMNDPDCLVFFTDGSATSKGGSGSGGYIMHHLYKCIQSDAAWFGRGFSYNMEKLVFSWALADGTASSLNARHIFIFTDSESLGKAFLDVKDGNAASLYIARTLRTWFSCSPAHQLSVSYVPGHSGVPGNKAIDELVGAVQTPSYADIEVIPTSLAFLRAKITCDITETNLRSRTHPQHPDRLAAHMGHDIPKGRITQVIQQLTHVSKNSPIRRWKQIGINRMSRLFRAITGHTPIGKFQMKMREKHHEPTFCPCGYNPQAEPGTHSIQDFEHILIKCPFYFRRPVADANGNPTVPDYLNELDPFPLILQFLLDNPTMFTFAEVPESSILEEKTYNLHHRTGEVAWSLFHEDPTGFLRGLPRGCPFTPGSDDIDPTDFIRTFYNDLTAYKPWATHALNLRILQPHVKETTRVYVNNLTALGRYDVLADLTDRSQTQQSGSHSSGRPV
ncbi:hypothetical protein LXA43DRAFT_1088594 [Ganoderma leucocontextum]|nr:hypothetical protein LXA43DRAFT_1088594 [Ganoderma leucocontextum]